MKTTLERLSTKFTIGNDCWEWTASLLPNGYGQFKMPGNRTTTGHRAMYEEMIGPVPEGLELDHLCRNRKCVRPDHLEPVTRRENLSRSPLWVHGPDGRFGG